MLLSLFAFALAPLQQDPADAFLRDFGLAMRVNEIQSQDRSLRRHREKAVIYFVTRIVPVKSPEDLWVMAFSESWKRVYRTEFPRDYITKIAGLSREDILKRSDFTGKKFVDVIALRSIAIASKNPEDWAALRAAAQPLQVGLFEVGDLYYSASVMNYLADSWNPDFQDGPGDPQKTFDRMGEFLQLRKDLGYIKDSVYVSMEREWKGFRHELGLEPESERAVKASPFDIRPIPGEGWHTLDFTFQSDKGQAKLFRPSDLVDDDTTQWLAAGVLEPKEFSLLPPHCGAKECFFGGPNSRVKVFRDSAIKFHLEAGGAPSEPFSLSPRPQLVLFEMKFPGGVLAQRAIWVATGVEQGGYNGIEMNQSINDNGGLLFFRHASSIVAKTPWGDLRLFEDNGDGFFSLEGPTLAGHSGMPKGEFFQRFDAVALGKVKRASPSAPWIPGPKGEWFELEMAPSVSPTLGRIRKVSPTLGKITVLLKGVKEVKLTSLILKAENDRTKGLYVDVAGNKSFQIPIGRYQLVQGFLEGKDGETALLVPPKSVPLRVDIDAETPAVLTLGAPFQLTGRFQEEDKEVVLVSDSVHVVGVAEESYHMMIGAPLFEIRVQVKGGKKGETERPKKSAAEADWHAAYFPAEFRLPIPKGKEALITLSIKKHPWFGKLSSDWIE